MFFDRMGGLVRVLVITPLTYAALVAFLRVSGKRTLAKLNAFDLVVTVALGSTLATVLLSKDVALAEGVLALAMLIGLQLIVAKLSVGLRSARRWFKSDPTLLVHEGRLLETQLQRQRVTPGEVRQALRQQGLASLKDAGAVVLETDGSLSVIKRAEWGPDSSLRDVTPPAELR